MKLTKAQIEHIETFFGKNKQLKDRFVELYNYQLLSVPDLIFDVGDGKIIGFKRKNERFLAYVYKQGRDFYLKTPNNSGVSFSASLSALKYELITNKSKQSQPVQSKSEREEIPLADISGELIDSTIGETPEEMALQEERENADSNYSALKREIDETTRQLPYPDVTPFSVEHDYDEIANLQSKKRSNKPYWEIINNLNEYYNLDVLYNGHLKIGNSNYYFMPVYLENKHFDVGRERTVLLSMDRAENNDLFTLWRFPKKDKGITFSRNIEMRNKSVEKVDIVYDSGDDTYSEITDLYLRNALLRNKQNAEVRSIIQTIQEKQNEIRTLDTDTPFIVQGCAGSGKTMVLLHRLRYLIANGFIKRNNYLLLVPGRAYKKYILKISNEFGIFEDNIISYTDYFRLITTKQYDADYTELDESVFPQEYLRMVYSEEFIRKCYSALIEDVVVKAERLIDLCERSLSNISDREENELSERKDKVFVDAWEEVCQCIEPVKNGEDCQGIEDFSGIPELIARLKLRYNSIMDSIRQNKSMTDGFELSPEVLDEYLAQDAEVAKLKTQIEEEEQKVKTASFFTVLSHKRKLKELQEIYDAHLSEIKDNIYKTERERFINSLPTVEESYLGLSREELQTMMLQIKDIYSSAIAEAEQCDRELKNFQSDFTRRYSGEIKSLQDAIEQPLRNDGGLKKAVCNLSPCTDILKPYIVQISRMVGLFKKFKRNKDEEKEFEENVKLFTNKTDNAVQGYLYTLLLNKSKRFIKDEFSINLCDKYKHYWYLSAWFNYLIRDVNSESRKYIFIDEAQDLSKGETEIINRYNADSDPVFNLFGDINQEVIGYGVKDWSEILYIPKLFVLDENFRNTNQIVDYCNTQLPFGMKAVGINQEAVGVYENLIDVVNEKGSDQRFVFIVKDVYAFEDFSALISEVGIPQFDVYTVKAAKGLEFKEVFVFEQGMTLNEKYISYTRALSKLNVIKRLPQKASGYSTKIIQGDDEEIA